MKNSSIRTRITCIRLSLPSLIKSFSYSQGRFIHMLERIRWGLCTVWWYQMNRYKRCTRLTGQNIWPKWFIVFGFRFLQLLFQCTKHILQRWLFLQGNCYSILITSLSLWKKSKLFTEGCLKHVGFVCSWSRSKSFIKSYNQCSTFLRIKLLMELIIKH